MVRMGARASTRPEDIVKSSNGSPTAVAANIPNRPRVEDIDEPVPKRFKPNSPVVTYSKRSPQQSVKATTSNVPASSPLKSAPSSPAASKSASASAPTARTRKEETSTPKRGKGNLVQALAASTQKSKPRETPSRKASTASIASADLPNFDEAFDASPTASVSAVSRETFRENEKLRAQREARNFVYKGDAEAPRLTRSGKVVANGKHEEVIDEYGGVVEDDEAESVEVEEPLESEEPDEGVDTYTAIPTEDVGIRLPDEVRLNGKEKTDALQMAPLPHGARGHVLSILETLTGRVSHGRRPFAGEETNEALQGLVNLLKGTVERGEGNSALVVGPRGAGKSRVSYSPRRLLHADIQTIARALDLMPHANKTVEPIVVRLSGHAQTNDRLAIREMGRQIAAAEGSKVSADDGEDDDGPVGDEEVIVLVILGKRAEILGVCSNHLAIASARPSHSTLPEGHNYHY